MINKKLDLIIKDLSLSTKMSQELMSKADDTQLTDDLRNNEGRGKYSGINTYLDYSSLLHSRF